MTDIERISLNGSTYDIKDSNIRDELRQNFITINGMPIKLTAQNTVVYNKFYNYIPSNPQYTDVSMFANKRGVIKLFNYFDKLSPFPVESEKVGFTSDNVYIPELSISYLGNEIFVYFDEDLEVTLDGMTMLQIDESAPLPITESISGLSNISYANTESIIIPAGIHKFVCSHNYDWELTWQLLPTYSSDWGMCNPSFYTANNAVRISSDEYNNPWRVHNNVMMAEIHASLIADTNSAESYIVFGGLPYRGKLHISAEILDPLCLSIGTAYIRYDVNSNSENDIFVPIVPTVSSSDDNIDGGIIRIPSNYQFAAKHKYLLDIKLVYDI